MFNFKSTLIIVVSVVFLSCQSHPRQAEGDALVKVGHEVITRQDIATLGRIHSGLKDKIKTDKGWRQVLGIYITQSMFFQEAKRLGINKSTGVRQKTDVYHRIIVADALLELKKAQGQTKQQLIDRLMKRYPVHWPKSPSRQSAGDVLVKVGREVITRQDITTLGRISSHAKAQLETYKGWQRIEYDYMIQSMFFQEGKRLGLDRSTMIRQKTDAYHRVVTINAFLEQKEVQEQTKDQFAAKLMEKYPIVWYGPPFGP